jgi:hypothetical protein
MVLRKDKLLTLCQISSKPNTSGSREEGYTSVVDDSECGMMTGSRAKPASNLNSASNNCTMHQISNMHHYLQVEELEEAGGPQGGGS